MYPLAIIAFAALPLTATVNCHAQPKGIEPSVVGQPNQLASTAKTPQSDPNIRGTKTSPLIVETVESPNDRYELLHAARFREQDASTNWWLMLLTGGLLGVAGVQAWLFVTQLRLMRRSIELAGTAASAAEQSVVTMQDTARRQLRAYISVDRGWIDFPEPGVPSVTVVIKNTGQTPAHNVRHWIHQWIETYPLKVQLPVPPHDFVVSESVLGSGATHNMCIKHPMPIIKEPYFDELGTPEGTIYVYGEVSYKDVFGEEQFVKYRLMHGGPQKPPPGVLCPCEEGNESS